MKINYLEDLYIPSLGEWHSEAAGDWLHPLHGPLPNHLGLLEHEGVEFMAALWELPTSITVMLEQLKSESTDPRVPMRHLDDVYNMRGWIAQTYKWEITTGGIKYKQRTIIPDKYEENDKWRRKIYRSVLEESVAECINSAEKCRWTPTTASYLAALLAACHSS